MISDYAHSIGPYDRKIGGHPIKDKDGQIIGIAANMPIDDSDFDRLVAEAEPFKNEKLICKYTEEQIGCREGQDKKLCLEIREIGIVFCDYAHMPYCPGVARIADRVNRLLN